MNHFDMELTQRQAKAYRKATKKQKGEILTRYCELTAASRNLASKRFRKAIRDIHPHVLKDEGEKKRRGRKPTYTNIHKLIVRKAWELSGEVCGERLHPVMVLYLKQLEENGELKYYGKRYRQETAAISQRTLKRIIASFPKADRGRKSKGNAAICKQIPIKAHFGDNANQAGYVEIDYVEHNSGSSAGLYAYTGSYVDVCLGWIARSAALGNNLRAIAQIHRMNEQKIHHQIREYHPDNARPILKLLLEKTLGEKPPGYTISRSRPYHKEDNGHVEQKNNDKVRKLVGYHRYETEAQVTLLNKLYQVEDLISNFFVPSQKLVARIRDGKGRLVCRKHDQARTAYQRLLGSGEVDQEVKEQVRVMYTRLNLVKLRREADRLQDELIHSVVLRK